MRFAAVLENGFAGTDVSLRHEYPATFSPARLLKLHRFDSLFQRSVVHPRALRNARADVFHIIDHSYSGAAIGLPAHRTVVTCHDLVLLATSRADLPAWERHAVERFRRQVRTMARVAAVVCVSETTKRDVLRFTDVLPERIQVIPNGVAAHFRPMRPSDREEARGRLGVQARYVLLHVSSGGFYKNVRATLQTVAALRASGREVALVRVGQPANREMRRLAARLGIAAYVKELGHPTDAELVSIYGAVDALIFPSLREGFGLPVLEAMACGTPVVASDISALNELLGGAGLIAPPHDTHALAAAVDQVLTVPDVAERLRAAGLARAQSFGWQRVIDDYRRLYFDVAQGRVRSKDEVTLTA